MIERREYILPCPECKGERSVYKTNGKRVFCPLCKGAGEVTHSKDYLVYRVMDLNRKINVNWDALEHRRSIPQRFLANIPLDCPVCLGEKKVKSKFCPSCKGSGYSQRSTRKAFRLLFQSFSSLKTQRDNLNLMIEEKTWLKERASLLVRMKPFKPHVVCTRCTHYLNENNNNPCAQCANHILSGKIILFNAITPSADHWYRKEGHKWNYRAGKNMPLTTIR